MWVELPRPVTGYVTFYNSTALFIDWKRINPFLSRIHLFTVLYSNKGKYSERHFLYFLYKLHLYFVHSPTLIRQKIRPDQTEVEKLYSLVDLLLQTGPDVDVLNDDGCPDTWYSNYMTLPVYIYLQRLHFTKSEWLHGFRSETRRKRTGESQATKGKRKNKIGNWDNLKL